MLEVDGLSPAALPNELEHISGRPIGIIAKGGPAAKEDQEPCLTAKQLWNRSAALKILGGDESLLIEMVQLFLVESPRLIVQIQHAMAHNDPPLLEMAAHCLKGQLSYLVAPEASEAADKLEAAGRTGDMVAATGLLADLQTQLVPLWTVVSQAGI
jgi:two-component system sensor histidine kinase/response regulator